MNLIRSFSSVRWSRRPLAVAIAALLAVGGAIVTAPAADASPGPRFSFADARRVHGAYDVDRTRTFTLVAVARHRPQYIDAAPYPQRPAGGDYFFVRDGKSNGRTTWELPVTVTGRLRSHRYWNVGIRTGGTVHRLKIRVLGKNDPRGLPAMKAGGTHHN